ncbi:MAG: LptA/OstA family protein [Pseudomonadota bacterium]
MTLQCISAACAAFMLASSVALAQGLGVSFEGLSADANAPLEIEAERLEVDQDNGDALFSGDVRVVRGEMRLSAPTVKITYTEDNGISRMLATGGAHLATAAEDMSASTVDYALEDDLILLSGDVVFVQGSTTISSERMRIDLKANSGVLEGSIRSIIQPRARE